jgi:hypothetical protein
MRNRSYSSAFCFAQLNDRTQNPNVANFGIAKSLTEQIGNGTGDWSTPDSSSFIIARDPFRAIRRGRQLFQRKFLRSQGQGPLQMMASGTSTPIWSSELVSATVAPDVMGGREEQQVRAAMW